MYSFWDDFHLFGDGVLSSAKHRDKLIRREIWNNLF